MTKLDPLEQKMKEYEQMIALAEASGMQSQMPYSSAFMGGQSKQNLVEWQLDFSVELDKIAVLLRNQVYNKEKDIWIDNPDSSKVTMNETGVQDILQTIFILVNKNKVLSNYDEDEIRQRVRMIQHELRVLIYVNYEKYGMDNEYKQNKYSMIVLTIGSLIEDAYRRAMNGEERKDLNTARVVNQNEPLSQPTMQFYPVQKRGMLSKLNPFNWGKGSYY